MLSVAVLVGELEELPTDLVQLYGRENGHRGRDAVLLRDGAEVARVADLPWERDDAGHQARAADIEGRLMLAGKLGPENVRSAIEAVDPWAVDASSQLEVVSGHQGPRADPGVRRGGALVSVGLYGPYGGRYVPETLIPALDELAMAWDQVQGQVEFRQELDDLLENYAGRPTPLTLAERFAPGKRLYLKREDLLHTGAHKLNNALGQVLLARRLGKRRIVAETGAGQHGVAVATACARFGLDCVVHMGAEDMRRQRPNVERMRLLGAEVQAGRDRNAHAEGGDERGRPRLARQRRVDVLPHRLLRRAAPVPGARPQPPGGDRSRGARADPRGGGPAARGRPSPASAAARMRSASSRGSWTTTCGS